MKNYQKILLAVDLSQESSLIAEKAQAIAEAFSSQLHVIHVVEPVHYGYVDTLIVDFSYLQTQVNTNAKNSLTEFSTNHQIAENYQHLALGRPAKKIQELAASLQADLIVIGTHGQHGFALLLGATANSVLHGSKCDVLAVRVGEINS